MKAKNIWFFQLVLILIVTVSSCKRSDVDPDDKKNKLADGQLSTVDADLIESLSSDGTTKVANLKFDDMTSVKAFLDKHDPELVKRMPKTSGAGDLSAEDQKRLFIGRFLLNGLSLSDKAAHVYAEEGTNAPAQKGIAYSFGSKDHTKRNTPTMGTCNKDTKVYGLDCSGFVYQLAKSSGINIGNPGFCNVDFLKNPENWNKALLSIPDYDKLEMKAEKNVPLDELRSGDIICWGISHIGIAGQGTILHSSGSANPGKNGLADCDANFKKGPRISEITKGFMDVFNGGVYTVLRLYPKCSSTKPLTIHIDYHKRGIAPLTYYFAFSVSGGKAPYNVSKTSNAGGSFSSSTPIECNVNPMLMRSSAPFSPITVRVTDSNGSKKDTVFISY